MNRTNFALLCVVWVLHLSMGCRQVQKHVENAFPTVDKVTRAKAADIKATDIKALRFTGPHFMRFANDPIVITDKAEIDRYLTALRHAYGRPQQVLDGVDILEIELLPRKGEALPSRLFFFNLGNELGSFGPEFHKEALALQARIAQENKNREASQATSAFYIANVRDNDVLPASS